MPRDGRKYTSYASLSFRLSEGCADFPSRSIHYDQVMFTYRMVS